MQVAVDHLEHLMQVEADQAHELVVTVQQVVAHELVVTVQQVVAHELVVTVQQVVAHELVVMVPQRVLKMQMEQMHLRVQPVSRTNLKSHQLVPRTSQLITVQTERRNRLTTLRNKRAIGSPRLVDSGVSR
jgi:hypothetical protein